MLNERYERARRLFTDRRDAVMVVAVLVASVTYTAAVSPPGGLWQDDLNSHEAGTSILSDKNPDRYIIFYYANATAFVSSLIVIALLFNEGGSNYRVKIIVLYFLMVLSLGSLTFAYAAACERSLSKSVYVIGLVGVFFLSVLTDHFLIDIMKFFFGKRFSRTANPQELVQEGVNPQMTQ